MVVDPALDCTVTGPKTVAAHSDPSLAAGLLLDLSLPAPVLVSPPDGAKFTNFPRTTRLVWKPVPDAVGYTITLGATGGFVWPLSSEVPEVTFDFDTDGAGTWQVWAIMEDGRRSPASEKRTFIYKT